MMWYGSPVDSVMFQGGTKPLLDSDVSLEEIAHDARCESFTWVCMLLSYIQMDEGCIVTNSRWCSGVVYLDWFHWLKAECVCFRGADLSALVREACVNALRVHLSSGPTHTHTGNTHTHTEVTHTEVTHTHTHTRDLSLVTESHTHTHTPVTHTHTHVISLSLQSQWRTSKWAEFTLKTPSRRCDRLCPRRWGSWKSS